jgi:hypothetical protein
LERLFVDTLITDFDKYSERILYGRLVRLAPKNSVEHDSITRETQERVHDLFTAMIAEMQTNPAAVGIPDIPDNPCKPGNTAAKQPELFTKTQFYNTAD